MIYCFSFCSLSNFPSLFSFEIYKWTFLNYKKIIIHSSLIGLLAYSSSFLFLHSFFVFTNQTSFEYFRRNKIFYLSKFQNNERPFDVDYFGNFFSFFFVSSSKLIELENLKYKNSLVNWKSK